MAPERKRFQNVLVATDFSPGGQCALARAMLLPLAPGATITVLYVIGGDASPVEQDQLEARATDAMRAAAARAEAAAQASGRAHAGARLAFAIARGTPFAEIIREARESHAELVVLGRHGRGRPFADLFLGSTAERVLRKGDRSVLLVNQAPKHTYRKPLLAVDLSEDSAHAARLAIGALDDDVREVEVLHAYRGTSLDDMIAEHMEALESAAGHPPPLDPNPARCPEPIKQALAGFLEGLGGGAQWTPLYREGDPRHAIVDVVTTHGHDLVAMGTHGRRGLAAVLLGSVASEVVRRAPCDVLVGRVAP